MTPYTAYFCAHGHRGPLCAVCDDSFYFKDNWCQSCDSEALSPGMVLAFAVLGSFLVLYLAFCYLARKHAEAMKPIMKRVRRTVAVMTKGIFVRKRRQQRMRRHRRRAPRLNRLGLPMPEEARLQHEQDKRDEEGDARLDAFTRITIALRATAVQAVHKSVKAAKEGIMRSSETVRICLNSAKVVAHLYSSLHWCIHWPSAMLKLRDMAAIFSLDIFSQARMPCLLTGFTFYTRIRIAIAAPLALIVVYILGCTLWESLPKQQEQRKRRRVVHTQSALNRELRRGTHNSTIKMGLWKAAPAVLFFIDLVYPVLTKTLFSFFICRDLGPAGWYLEADYSQKCRDNNNEQMPKYASYYPWVWVAAMAFAVGVPVLFWYLVSRYSSHGQAGDRVVQSALGWMCPSEKNAV